MKRPLVVTLIGIPSLLAAVAAWNYLSLQHPFAKVIEADPRNAGVSVFAHYEGFVNPRVLVFDLRGVGDANSPMDVTRTLIQYAEAQKDRKFDRVVLSHDGSPRFVLTGDYFQLLGEEYGTQNPVYTLRTMPENLYTPGGTRAFGTWSGGLLGVAGKQMEDFGEFHRRWYIADLAAEMHSPAEAEDSAGNKARPQL